MFSAHNIAMDSLKPAWVPGMEVDVKEALSERCVETDW
jgi:hypothetical protein